MTTDDTLLATQWPAICQQRARFYDWFCALFARELDAAQIAAYGRGEAAPLLDGCARLGLADAANRVQQAVAGFNLLDQARIELAADFAQLFLLDQRSAALPYASFYIDAGQRLYGPQEAAMRAFLAEGGLQVQADFREPADHLAVYLAALAHWSRTMAKLADEAAQAEAARQQAEFLATVLLSWLPEFVARCQAIRVSSDFYPALAALLLAFVTADAEALQDF